MTLIDEHHHESLLPHIVSYRPFQLVNAVPEPMRTSLQRLQPTGCSNSGPFKLGAGSRCARCRAGFSSAGQLLMHLSDTHYDEVRRTCLRACACAFHSPSFQELFLYNGGGRACTLCPMFPNPSRKRVLARHVGVVHGKVLDVIEPELR